MKKLIFTIINMNRGGAQRVLVNLLNNLDHNKYDITVLALNNEGDLDTELNKGIHYKYIVNVKNKFIGKIFSYLVRRVINPSIIARLFIGNKYDYEIAYLEGECTRLIGSHNVSKDKKYAWVHINLLGNTGSMGLYSSKEDAKNTYMKFKKVICVSESARQAFYECFGLMENVSVLYNVVDEQQVIAKSKKAIEKWRGPGINLLMVGNFRVQKAYDRMMVVCDKLKKEGLVFTLTILGSGAEFERVKALSEQLGLGNTIQMMGAVSNPYPYMKEADILVVSSIQEGFSTVVIESLLLGLPTLTTDCSGMSEILDNGKYGIIVENDTEALYNGLKRVIEHPEIIEGYKRLLPERKAFFSTEKRIKETEALFK